MRDVSHKITTLRTATARAILEVSPDTITRIKHGSIPKGDPLPVAKVAAIQSAKNCANIIPYCHPLPIDFVGCEFKLFENKIEVLTVVKAIYKTGVEMEAMMAASVAALTLYDMLKMIDDKMKIVSVELVEKRGGKSDFEDENIKSIRAAVLVMSDSISAGKKSDTSGKLIETKLKSFGVEIVEYKIIPDELEIIQSQIKIYSDEMKLDLVISTGGTGFTTRDTTPEALKPLIEKEIPGIVEAMRNFGQARTPYAMLSRAVAGLRGKTLIVTLPGSKNGAEDSLDAILPALLHSFKMIHSGEHKKKV